MENTTPFQQSHTTSLCVRCSVFSSSITQTLSLTVGSHRDGVAPGAVSAAEDVGGRDEALVQKGCGYDQPMHRIAVCVAAGISKEAGLNGDSHGAGYKGCARSACVFPGGGTGVGGAVLSTGGVGVARA